MLFLAYLVVWNFCRGGGVLRSAFCDSASLMQVDKNEYSTSSPYELVDEIMMNVGN